MGAISSSASIPVLREFVKDTNRDVRETCEIALAKIDWDHSPEGQKHWDTTAKSAEQCVFFSHFSS